MTPGLVQLKEVDLGLENNLPEVVDAESELFNFLFEDDDVLLKLYDFEYVAIALLGGLGLLVLVVHLPLDLLLELELDELELDATLELAALVQDVDALELVVHLLHHKVRVVKLKGVVVQVRL